MLFLPVMRITLFLAVVILSACSGRGSVDERPQSEVGGAGGDAPRVTGCDRANMLGSYVVSFEKLSGECGTPADERAVIVSLEGTVPCQPAQPDEWSADNCTRRQSLECGEVAFARELTLQPDGSLSGTETRSIRGGCSGTYAVTYRRQ